MKFASILPALPKLSRSAKLGIAVAGLAAFVVLPVFEQTRVSALLSLGNVGAYAILAVGIVMIYRASKVLNLAHGAMVMFPPYVVKIMTGGASTGSRALATIMIAATAGPLLVSLLQARMPWVLRFGRFSLPVRNVLGLGASLATFAALMQAAKTGLPIPVAVALGVVAGGALGYLVERVFVRALRAQGPTAQTVGTVAALGLVVAVAAKIFGTQAQNPVTLFPARFFEVAGGSIKLGEVYLFCIALAITGSLILLFQKTDLGLVMRGTAENRRAAALMGIDPDRITALTWIMGGALAGISGILLASVTNLHPYVLSLQALSAFVAALLAGMASLSGAIGGAAIVGLTQSIFPNLGPLKNIQGVEQLFLALVAVGAMVTRGQRIVGGDVRSESIAASGARGSKRGLGGLAQAKRPLALLGVALFIAFPFLPFVELSLVASVNKGAVLTMVAISLVLLIGWVGQISLGHAALVGIGAYATGWVAKGFGVPFPLSLPLAAAVAAGIAALLGFVAVRVRGLFLAVATLIFSWMSSEFLFRQDWFIKHFQIDNVPIGREGTFPFFDFSQSRTLYFAAWAVVAIGLLAAANLRDSKTGRAFFAVQGSEMAAASLGINVTRYKLIAFSISGFLAGAAGSLLMSDSRVVGPDDFAFNRSLLFVGIAVVGGLRSLGGAVGAGLIFAVLDYEIFFRIRQLNGYLEIVGAGLLAIVLLLYPGGVAALGSQISHLLGRTRVVRWLSVVDRGLDVLLADVTWAKQRAAAYIRGRLDAPALEIMPALAVAAPAARLQQIVLPSGGGPMAEPLEPGVLPPNRADRPLIVRSENVTVRFGGLTAVNNVTMEVRQGEIVGLIGPNGAGKTVSFNSIAGIVTPTEGRVFLYGKDVTDAPVHERARLGIARTFQVLQLFPALTVFENLLVGTHLQNETDVLAHLTATPTAVAAEADARRRVREVVDLLGLNDVVDKYPGDLPFGTLRMVEVARALVTDLKFVMLDEAFSGLDDTETEALVEALMKVRQRLGVTLLLIEHDVKLIMSVCDYVYCIDRGNLIAEGVPAQVQRDPAVIAAYIGKAADDVEQKQEAMV